MYKTSLSQTHRPVGSLTLTAGLSVSSWLSALVFNSDPAAPLEDNTQVKDFKLSAQIKSWLLSIYACREIELWWDKKL